MLLILVIAAASFAFSPEPPRFDLSADLGSSMVDSLPTKAPVFPEDWVGNWKGHLVIERGQQVLMTTTFRLAIHPADSNRYTWGIQYGEEGQDNRPYTMYPTDSTRTHWVVDEDNGIFLHNYVHGDVVYSQFDVLGNLLFTRDQLIGDTLFHEIVTAKQHASIPSGDTLWPNAEGGVDTIPPVKAYPIVTRQWSKMVRSE